MQIFLERLRLAPPCKDAEEALALICRLIEEVEDEHAPVPREDPPPMRFTGRMYAPQANRVERHSNGMLIASSRHHRIYCLPDGAVRIEHVPSQQTVMSKPGKI